MENVQGKDVWMDKYAAIESKNKLRRFNLNSSDVFENNVNKSGGGIVDNSKVATSQQPTKLENNQLKSLKLRRNISLSNTQAAETTNITGDKKPSNNRFVLNRMTPYRIYKPSTQPKESKVTTEMKTESNKIKKTFAESKAYVTKEAKAFGVLAKMPADSTMINMNLNSDFESYSVLFDEDSKDQGDTLDKPLVNVKKRGALAQQHLKRKITPFHKSKYQADDGTDDNATKLFTKKIDMNRTPYQTYKTTQPTEKSVVVNKTAEIPAKSDKVKITFGDIQPIEGFWASKYRQPVPMPANLENRKGQLKWFERRSTVSTTSSNISSAPNIHENLEKFKKRSKRFGQSVSQVMIDFENKEKMEKRKAKFATT